jgi:apolipoprotein N-acyltransferase
MKMKTIGAGAMSCVAGAVVGLGYAPTDYWWIVVPGIATFINITLSRGRLGGYVCGYLFGFGLALVAFRWTSVTGIAVPFVFAAFLGLWYALVGLVVAAAKKTPAWGFLGVGVWMSIEWACARVPFGGFGWGRLAYTAVGTPLAGFFPLVSATGVSFIIISTAFLLVAVTRYATNTELATRPRVVITTCVAVGAFAFSGLAVLLNETYDPPPSGDEINVGVVQGNVPGVGIHAIGPAFTVDNNHLAETILLSARVRAGLADQPNFVVWPENSTATDPYVYTRTARIISIAVEIIGAPILVGTITHGPGEDERQTTALWWTTADEVTSTYHKRNLVPFGEWVPWPSLFVKLVPMLDYVGDQSVPGTTVGVLDVDVGGRPLRVGDLICFELAYDSTFDDVILGDESVAGAQVVVVQTSNAMFTGSTQMAQQDRITRVRAMESRREIAIATTNSLAGLIDTRGRVVQAAELGTSDSFVFTVPLRTHVTPGVAHRGWFDAASIVLPILAGLLALGYHVRRRHERKDQPS